MVRGTGQRKAGASSAHSRKLQALGLLIAETKVTPAAAGECTAAIRAVVAQGVPITGTVAMGLLVLVLSSALLPTFEVLQVLLAIVALVTWLLWRSFIKIYSKAQAALQETFAQPPPPRPHDAPATLPSLLRETNLETVTIAADSLAVSRLIRELELRTRTGASIINLGAEEKLQSGDQVLLLGTRAQLGSAKATLSRQA